VGEKSYNDAGGETLDIKIAQAGKIKNDVESELSVGEEELLYNASRSVPDTEVIVEIGRGNGISTRWLAKGSSDGNMSKLYNIISRLEAKESIDTDENEINGEFKNNLENEGSLNDWVDFSYTDSEETVKRWKEKIGLLCINVLCDYEDMKGIFGSWKRHLSSKAGVIIFNCDSPGSGQIIKDQLGNMGDFVFEKRAGSLILIRSDKCIHYLMLDSSDVGICRYCNRVRNFRKMRRESTAAEARKRRKSTKKDGNLLKLKGVK